MIDLVALRAAACGFGYAVASASDERQERVWYVTPAGATAALCVGVDSEFQRFVLNHARWALRPGGGAKRMTRWQQQKLRAASRKRRLASEYAAAARPG